MLNSVDIVEVILVIILDYLGGWVVKVWNDLNMGDYDGVR